MVCPFVRVRWVTVFVRRRFERGGGVGICVADSQVELKQRLRREFQSSLLDLFGGRRGLIELSRDLCAHPYRATVHLVAQNGKLHDISPVVGNSCTSPSRRIRIGEAGVKPPTRLGPRR
jgi:hypothetical protein